MFQHTRIRLTAWYLLIIMSISLSFSFVLYKETSHEVERFARIQQLRFGRIPHDEEIVNDLLQTVKQRILLRLGMINLVILLATGGLGYFLAGKTLHPIQLMVDEQNRFVSDASHELKTPLTSLKTAMEVHLRDKNTTLSQANNLIRESIGEVNRLQSLSEGLLQISQYDKSNRSIKQEDIILSTVIRNAVDKMENIAQGKQIKMSTKLIKGSVRGNTHALTDLFILLLDNAVKYSTQNSEINIEEIKTEKYITVTIKDQGMGIEEKDMSHIFDRFYRADSARKKNGSGGYGLGLSIAKKIVEFHHGFLQVESEVDKGSTFTIRLPISQKAHTKLSIFS